MLEMRFRAAQALSISTISAAAKAEVSADLQLVCAQRIISFCDCVNVDDALIGDASPELVTVHSDVRNLLTC